MPATRCKLQAKSSFGEYNGVKKARCERENFTQYKIAHFHVA